VVFADLLHLYPILKCGIICVYNRTNISNADVESVEHLVIFLWLAGFVAGT
jgi:hypothetical protein